MLLRIIFPSTWNWAFRALGLGVSGLETFMPCGEGILYVRPARTNSLSFPGKQEDFSQTILFGYKKEKKFFSFILAKIMRKREADKNPV